MTDVQVAVAGIRPADGYRYSIETYGYHHGQSDRLACAYNGDGQPVGWLDYAVFAGVNHINIIMVQETRKGIGLALLRHVADDEHLPFRWGLMTPAGTALRSAWLRNGGKEAPGDG